MQKAAIARLVTFSGLLFLGTPPLPVFAQVEAPPLERRIEVGEFHLRSGRWQDAVAVFEPLSRRTDASADVFRGLGEAYLNLGRRDDAIRALEEAQRRGPDERSRLLLVGLLGDRPEGWSRAIDLLQAQVAANPSDIDSRRRLGELLVYENRIEEAVPVLRSVVAARPEDAQALLLYGRSLAWTGRFADAQPVFDRALAAGGALAPEDRKLVAQAEEAAGNAERAFELYRATLQVEPSDPVALAGAARTGIDTGRTEAARDAIDRLRSLALRDPQLELQVARLDIAAGRREAALPAFARAFESDPSPALAQEYADLLASLGRSEDAVEVISKVPDPSPAGAANRLRILAASPAHQEEARALALELLRSSPTAEASRAARDLVLTTPDRDLSLALVDAVARQYPRDRALQSKLAGMLLARGETQRAERVLEQLQARAPGDAEVVASLVATQVENRNFAAARQTLEEAGALVGRDARLLSLRAGLEFADGNIDAARAGYTAALERNPRLAEARIGLAEVALAEGNVAEAEALLAAAPPLPARAVADLRERLDFQAMLERYRTRPTDELAAALEPRLRAELERQPGRADYRLTLAQILEARGQSREALAEYVRLQEVEPPLREAYLAPLRIELALGDQEAAERSFARFQARFPGEEAVAQARLFAGQGEERKRAGDYAGALEAYRKALELAPRNVDIWNGVAGVHFQFGNPEAALDAFENALAVDPGDRAARRGRTDALTALAGEALERGERETASRFLERALAAGSSDPETLERIAQLALGARDWDVARAAAERLPEGARASELRALVDVESELATRLDDPQVVPAAELLALARRGLAVQPDRADLLLLEAQALERLGEHEQAYTAFRRAGAKGATSPDVYAGQVRTAAHLGDFAAATTALGELERRAPAVARAAEIDLRLQQANAYREAGRSAAAFEAAADAVRLDPDSVAARMALAAAASDAGDLDTAVSAYEVALAQRPDDPDAALGLAGARFAAGRLDEALQAFDAVLDRDPANRRAVVGRADVLAALAGRALERGDVEAARDYAARSLERSNGITAALERTFETALSAQAYDVAERAVAQLPPGARRDDLALRVASERRVAALRAGEETASPAETLAAVDAALAFAPERADLLLLRAQMLERLGESEDALVAFRRAAAVSSPSADAFAGQVRTLAALGRVREARLVFAELQARDAEAAATAEFPLLLAEANLLAAEGRAAEAIGAVESARRIEPDNAGVLATLGGLHAEAGDHRRAIEAFTAALELRPRDPVLLEGLAGSYFALGDLVSAAATYDRLLAFDPENPVYRRERASLWVATAGRALAEGRVAAADEALDRALALAPNNRDAMAMKLQVVVGRDDFTTARRLIATVGDAAWRRELESWLAVEEGVARWRADRSTVAAAEMLRLVERGLRADPNRADLRLVRAQVLEASGDSRAALAAYRELAQLPDAPVEAVAGQVRTLIDLERFAEAETLVDRLVTLRPEAANSERAKLHRARAAALKELGQSTAAFASARDALALQPGDPDTLTLLGWIYLDTKQPADAAASFAAALEAQPRDPVALEGLALASEALGDWDAAERFYRELAAIGGEFPTAARERIARQRAFAQLQALRDEGRLQAAADLLEGLRQRHPRDPDVWAALSEVRNELGQGSLALTYAEQGLALAPDSERLHLARVRALVGLGRWDAARAAIDEARGHASAAELASLNNDVARALARAERERWMREGRLDLAYLSLAEEYQLAPRDPDVLRAIGYLYLETEQYPEARQFFERAVRVDPQNPDGQMGLAYALRGDGEPRLAVERIESVMQARPSADAALALAELYHERGRHRDAAEMLAVAKRLGGEPRRVLPPLRIDQARAVAPELRAERGSVLPPLMLPQGVVRAVPDRPPAVPVYEEFGERSPLPPQRSSWRDGRLLDEKSEDLSLLAFADTGIVSDAAPPEALAFAGPALEAMRRGIAADEPLQLAQALPSFDRVMEDVRGAPRTGGPSERIRDEYLPPAPVEPRDGSYGTQRTYRTVEDYVPAAPQPPAASPYAIDPTLPPSPAADAPTPYERRFRYYEYGDVEPGAAPVPETLVAPPALPPVYDRRLYLERSPAGAGLPIREPIQPPTPLDPEARARMTALERKLQRAQTMKVSVGFRWDFLDSVSDVIADEFVLWRFPVYLELPALVGSRLRVTGEPTIIDNGIVTDTGVAGEVAILGLPIGTDIVQASAGVGVTPAGFRDGVDITGFARLTLQLAERLSLTPFFERKPVIESLLSYRGNEREGIFFGKVMQNRFGGTFGYSTPQEIDGVFEVAYSTLEGVRVEDNEKIDAFFSIGRDFAVGSGYVVRPGAQAYFFHYDKDLSESYPLGLDPVLFPEDEFPRGGGYFSPDSFFEAALRLDLRGPLMPYTFPGSTFRVGGRVGGQWISGVDAPRFRDAEGSRATFGGDAGIDVPLGEVVVFSAGTGFVVADPYNRIYFEMALLFPL